MDGYQNIGAWRAVNRVLMEDSQVSPVLITELQVKLLEQLRENWAEPEGGVTLHVSDSHADFFIRNQVVVLAEQRVFVRLIPNPMPQFDLFPRLTALGRRISARLPAALHRHR